MLPERRTRRHTRVVRPVISAADTSYAPTPLPAVVASLTGFWPGLCQPVLPAVVVLVLFIMTLIIPKAKTALGQLAEVRSTGLLDTAGRPQAGRLFSTIAQSLVRPMSRRRDKLLAYRPVKLFVIGANVVPARTAKVETRHLRTDIAYVLRRPLRATFSSAECPRVALDSSPSRPANTLIVSIL